MKNLSKIIVLFLSMFGTVVIGQETATGSLKKAKIDADRESALNTVAYINQMNYAYAVMKTHHNVLAVQEEYDKISIDRIDITRIPAFSHKEKAMVDLIRSMSDSLKKLKMIDEDYRYYQEVMEDRRRRARKDMWLKIVASVPLALKDASDVIVKQSDKGDAYTVSFNALMTLAGDIIGGPVTAAMNYNKTLDELRAGNKDRNFEYKRENEKAVHDANKNLIEAEFEFVKDKNLKREDIVTPDELQSLVDALKNTKVDRVFKLLDTPYMRSHYRRFAPYWFYLASFAIQCKNYAVAIEAADTFFIEHRALIKVDPMVAQTAIAGVTALIATGSSDHTKIRGWLHKILDVNYNSANPDYSYFCADVMYHFLNDSQSAQDILEQANAYVENCFENTLRTYRNKYSEGEISIGENDLPKDIDLVRIRTLYNDILAEKRCPEDLSRNVLDICANQTASSIEKLFYIGRVRVDDIWKEARKDVLAMKLRYVPHWRENRFKVEIPVSWFLLGEVESRVMLQKGTNVVVSLSENVGERTIRQNDAGIGSDIVTMTFMCRQKVLKGVDSVKFVFEHKSWPIEITYKPSLSFNVQAGIDTRNEVTEYVPVKISFMGEEKDLTNPPDNIKTKILSDKIEKHSCFLLPFQYGLIEYCTNFLTSVSIDSDRSLEVAYTNPTPYQATIDLDVSYYSKYGARLCNVNAQQKITPASGGKWKLAWPSDMNSSELPSYVFFQYHIDDSVYDWAKNYLRRRKLEKGSNEQERTK